MYICILKYTQNLLKSLKYSPKFHIWHLHWNNNNVVSAFWHTYNYTMKYNRRKKMFLHCCLFSLKYTQCYICLDKYLQRCIFTLIHQWHRTWTLTTTVLTHCNFPFIANLIYPRQRAPSHPKLVLFSIIPKQ